MGRLIAVEYSSVVTLVHLKSFKNTLTFLSPWCDVHTAKMSNIQFVQRTTCRSVHKERIRKCFKCGKSCKEYVGLLVTLLNLKAFREIQNVICLDPLGAWMFVCCVVLCRQRSLRRAYHSSRGVLPCVCMCVIKKPRKGRPKVRPGLQAPVSEWICLGNNLMCFQLFEWK
jgi:hypothetical protein